MQVVTMQLLHFHDSTVVEVYQNYSNFSPASSKVKVKGNLAYLHQELKDHEDITILA